MRWATRRLVRSGTDWKTGSQTIDAGTVQAFIDKLRDLAAAKFSTTGFTTPAFRIAVTSNDGKRVEKVDFAKVTDGYMARRENEPALYQIDTKAADDISVQARRSSLLLLHKRNSCLSCQL